MVPQIKFFRLLANLHSLRGCARPARPTPGRPASLEKHYSLLSSHRSFTMATDNAGKGILLKAEPIATAFRDEIKAALNEAPRPPKLVGILATSSAPSKFYAEFTQKQCNDLGVDFVLKKIGAAADPSLDEGEGVEDAIIEANNNDSIDGIMVGIHALCISLILRRYRRLCRVPLKGLLSHLRRSTGSRSPLRHGPLM